MDHIEVTSSNQARELALAPFSIDVEGGASYLKRIAYTLLGSEFLPATWRTRLMQRLGFDVASTATIWSGCRFRSNRVKIAHAAFLNIGFFHDGSASLDIGENVRTGPFVKIITSTHEIGPPDQRCTFEARIAPVRIEKGCWIGANVVILPGVTVAAGCVVGAGSLVTRSTSPNGLYLGTPARRIRDLPSEESDDDATHVEQTQGHDGPESLAIPIFLRCGSGECSDKRAAVTLHPFPDNLKRG